MEQQLERLQNLANQWIQGEVFIRLTANDKPLYGFDIHRSKATITKNDYTELKDYFSRKIEQKKQGEKNVAKLKSKYRPQQMLESDAKKLAEKLSPEIAKTLGVESAGIGYELPDKGSFGRAFYLTHLDCRRLRQRIMLGGDRDSIMAKIKEIAKGALPACRPKWFEEED